MNDNVTICRDENLLNKVVLVDGQAGCGKTLLTSIVSSFERVEILNYAPEIENICILEDLGKISRDASETMIKIQMDLCLYETMMSRRVNFRYKDLSSVLHSVKFFEYIKRLFSKGDETIPQKIKNQKPILNYAVHNLLSYSRPLFKVLNDKFLIIEVVRHPLYMIIQNTINHRNVESKSGLARQFRVNLKIKYNEYPYQFHLNEDLYKTLKPSEKAIYDIDYFTKRTQKFKNSLTIEQSKNILTIPFEHFVLFPDKFINIILSNLETFKTSKTNKLLKKHKVPRKKISDGISLDIYKRYGWTPPVKGFSEKDELIKRRDFVLKEGVSNKYLEILDKNCQEYENNFLKKYFMNNRKIIAILPMRSGSQRIINKNTRLIKNKFLYEYIVDKILEIKMISKILINTDIESVHKKYKNNNKIELIQRGEKLKGNCNINLVIAETITNVESDLFVQVHATNPLFNITTLESAINFYFENISEYDSLFSVTEISKRFWYKSGNPVNHKINDEPTTQNLEPYLEENSCFYLFSKMSFFKQNNRIGLNPKLFEISKEESWDVDEEADLSILEKLLNGKINFDVIN